MVEPKLKVGVEMKVIELLRVWDALYKSHKKNPSDRVIKKMLDNITQTKIKILG